jgi:hypothetical protein
VDRLQRAVISSIQRCGAVLIAAMTLFASCGGRGEIELALDENPPLSSKGWAVVAQAYVRVKDGPSSDSRDLGHLRKGTLAEILGSDRGTASKGADKGLWYKLKAEGLEGWVREAELGVFASKAQAERASSGYR